MSIFLSFLLAHYLIRLLLSFFLIFFYDTHSLYTLYIIYTLMYTHTQRLNQFTCIYCINMQQSLGPHSSTYVYLDIIPKECVYVYIKCLMCV
uniref:Uncharacterized protein n=1 Tax=Octopus bimaculoides TaxID=37653 RepID=A0A0L8HDW0_OCTBM